MPLPDESPRGSVANLIGRFETHTKRSSLSGSISASSRSSSVVSQTSTNGDSAAAEIREKREWPPRNAVQQQQESRPAFAMPSYLRPSVGHLASTVASSLASAGSGAAGGPGKSAPPSPPTNTEDTSSSLQTAAPDNRPTPPSVSRSSSRATLNPNETVKLPEEQVGINMPTAPASEEVDPGTPKPGTISRKASTLTITPATDVKASSGNETPVTAKPLATSKPPASSADKPSSAQKAPAKAAAATPKTPAKAAATPKTSAKAKSLTPASSMQSLRPQHTGQSATGGSASGSARKPASSYKPPAPTTPARSKTPSAKGTPSRAKSPTPPVPRAKTPSTGLYAPTAASLARSRTAHEAPPPPPVKKVFSSEVADRLTRPTAASLSKARSAVSTTTSPRPSTTPIKKAATMTGTPSKGTPATPSKGGIKKASTISPSGKKEKPDSTAIPAAPAVVTAAVAVVAADKQKQEEGPVAVGSEQVEEMAASESEPTVEVSEEKQETNGHAVEGSEVKVAVDNKEEVKEETTNGSETTGNNLEDLVNMLEFKPVSAIAANTAAISDIPDEE